MGSARQGCPTHDRCNYTKQPCATMRKVPAAVFMDYPPRDRWLPGAGRSARGLSAALPPPAHGCATLLLLLLLQHWHQPLQPPPRSFLPWDACMPWMRAAAAARAPLLWQPCLPSLQQRQHQGQSVRQGQGPQGAQGPGSPSQGHPAHGTPAVSASEWCGGEGHGVESMQGGRVAVQASAGRRALGAWKGGEHRWAAGMVVCSCT